MIIELENMAFVVGREMANVKRLQEVFGIEIVVPRGLNGTQIILKGPADKVAATKKDIKESFHQITFLIEKEYVPLVIGPKGQRIGSLRAAHIHAKITITNDGKIKVVGKESECHAVKEKIKSQINKVKMVYPFEDKFLVPAGMKFLVAGRDYSNVKRIASTYNVQVSLPSSKNCELSEIWVKGKSAEEVSAAKREILESWDVFFIKKEDLGLLIGRKGQKLRFLEKEFDVTITIIDKEDGKVVIVGKKSGWEACKKAVELLIRKVTLPVQKLGVPSSQLDSVVGMNQLNVTRIESIHNDQVIMPSKKNGKSEIWVKGTSVEDVEADEKDIVDYLPEKSCSPVDEGSYGSIIGRGGEMVRRLWNKLDVQIDFLDG